MDVMCNKFQIGKVQESSRSVQWAEHISQHLEQKAHLSISGLLQTKLVGWLSKCLIKISNEVRFVLEILKTLKLMASELP